MSDQPIWGVTDEDRVAAYPCSERPEVYVHAEFASDDAVRTFYEVPDQIVEKVRAQATYEGQPFDSCLHDIVLAFEGALAEMARLKRESVREVKARRAM